MVSAWFVNEIVLMPEGTGLQIDVTGKPEPSRRTRLVMATDWFHAARLPTNCLMLARTGF